MAEDVHGDILDILGDRVAATIEKGVGLGPQGEVDRRSGRSPVLNQLRKIRKQTPRSPRLPRGEYQIDDVILDLVIHVDLIDQAPGIGDSLGFHDRHDLGGDSGVRHAIENASLLLAIGVIHDQLEHESIGLGFRQGIGSLLLDRILGGEYEKGIVQREGLPADGDLALLHRFQQGALDLGGGAIDLVGENYIREDRPFLDHELAVLRLKDQRADQVRRQQIRRERDTLEARVDARGKGGDGGGLGESGNPFDEDVSIAEQADHHPVQKFVLADDDLVHVFHQISEGIADGFDVFTHLFDVELRSGHVPPRCVRLAWCDDVSSGLGEGRSIPQKDIREYRHDSSGVDGMRRCGFTDTKRGKFDPSVGCRRPHGMSVVGGRSG